MARSLRLGASIVFAGLVAQLACVAPHESYDEPVGEIEQAVKCPPKLVYYPVRGKHNNGYDKTAGNSSLWSCGNAYSNSDFVSGDHLGNDVWAAEGTPVVAATSGKFTLVGYTSYSGNKVTIIDDCGWYHFYTHFQKLGPGISTASNGTRATAGQIIGYVGKSGTASNGVVHLHYSLYPDGNYSAGVDPYPYLRAVENDVCSVPGSCTPTPETCNGKDDDCDGAVDEDDVCGTIELERSPETYAPTRSSDVDGDGKSDVCGRGIAGFWCQLSTGTTFSEKTAVAAEFNAASASSLRMGDVDGDGKADVCGRSAAGFFCALSDGKSFSRIIEGPRWSDAAGWSAPRYATSLRLADVDGDGKLDVCALDSKGLTCARWTGGGFTPTFAGPAWSDAAVDEVFSTLRMGDVNGDGKDDACLRTHEGVDCYLSNGTAFDQRIEGPRLSDASGWSGTQYASTIRLADVNGDGKADLCARDSNGYFCHFSTGSGFGGRLQAANWSNAAGFTDVANHRTIRVADIDGDGRADICANTDTGIECARWDGAAFAIVKGPKLADAAAFSLMLGDADGDGRADLFARPATGGAVHLATGTGFGDALNVGEFGDEGGWNDPKYWTTLRFGGVRAKSETTPPPSGGSNGTNDPGAPPAAAPSGDTADSTGCSTTTARGGAYPSIVFAIVLLLRRRRVRA